MRHSACSEELITHRRAKTVAGQRVCTISPPKSRGRRLHPDPNRVGRRATLAWLSQVLPDANKQSITPAAAALRGLARPSEDLTLKLALRSCLHADEGVGRRTAAPLDVR
jgi:hypothetical protein